MKAVKSVSLDTENIEFFESEKTNISAFCNDAMTKYREKKTAPAENLILLEQQKNELTNKINQISKEIDETKNKQILYAEQQRKDAIERKDRREKAIKQEISYLPVMRERGFFSTKAKRERTYKQRAAAIGLTLDEYLSEVIERKKDGQ